MTTCTCHSTPIAHELATCLRRYERLSAPPRHLQFPVVGDLAGYERAHQAAITAGRVDRARELGLAIDDELTRRGRLADWTGRSSDAWDALVCRLWNARQDAVQAGVLDRNSESYRLVSDRLADAKRQAEAAEQREQLDRDHDQAMAELAALADSDAPMATYA